MGSSRFFGIAICIGAIICGSLAAAAPAAEFEAEGTAPVTVSGHGASGEAPVFTLDGTKVECETVAFEGTMTSIVQTTFEATPSYTSCKGFGGLSTTVSTSGCKYKFLEPTGSGPFSGQFSLGCGEGSIKITGGTCEVQIKSQGPSSGLTHEDVGTEPVHLRTKAALEKLVYNRTKDGIGCVLTGTGVKEDGKYSGGAEFESTQGETAFGLSSDWMTANPAKVEFPNKIKVGQSDKKPLEFTFTGTVLKQINILVARVTNNVGTPFKAVNNGCKAGVLKRGVPCTLEVEFKPEKAGLVTATAELQEDGGLGRLKKVPVEGTGE
jgi:hypothetical protein